MAVDLNGIMNWRTVGDTLGTDHIPEIILCLLGTTMLFIVTCYLRNEDGFVYKLLVLFGVVIGIIAATFCVAPPVEVTKGTFTIIAIGCSTLIIRPFRNVHFALIAAIFGMAVVYIALADIREPIDFLNNNWLRIIASFVVGSIMYMMLGFLQAIVLGLAKFLNAWPILMIIGIICMVEAICLCMGYNSVLDSIVDFVDGKRVIL